MSAGPDVAGIWAALARLSDRTPDQRRLDEQSEAAIRAADEYLARDEEDEDEFAESAVQWVREVLADVRLSKTARAAVEKALDAQLVA